MFRFKPCITGEFMGSAPKFKNRFLKRPFLAPCAQKLTFSKNDKRACNRPVTNLNFKDDGQKRDVKIFNSPAKCMQNLHNPETDEKHVEFFAKKTRLK